MSQQYIVSIDTSDDEVAEIVRIVREVAGENAATVEDASAAMKDDHFGVLDVADVIHLLIDVGENLALGVLSNAIYSRLTARRKHHEVSLHERVVEKDIEMIDLRTGLRLRIRESRRESKAE